MLFVRRTKLHATRMLIISIDCLLMAAFSVGFSQPAVASFFAGESSMQQELPMLTKQDESMSEDASETPAANPQASELQSSGPRVGAWMYPDEPKAKQTLEKLGHIDTVKAEFMRIEDSGDIVTIEQAEDAPNGYSPENVAFLKEHTSEQYITISGWNEGTEIAMTNPRTRAAIVALAQKADMNVELDWEGFGQWTPDYYAHFKTFIKQLGSALHAHDKKLIIDGPPINDENSQNWYQWKYEELAPLVDGVVMMIYDNQYDTGVGNSIAPVEWSAQCLQWLKEKAGDKGIAGIAAYGYRGDRASGRMAVLPSDQITRSTRTLTKHRNADGEIVAQSGNTFYSYADKTTLNRRYQQVQKYDIPQLSVWSLGSNPWFSQ